MKTILIHSLSGNYNRMFDPNEDSEYYISNANEQEYMRYQIAIQDYLSSERFAKFLSHTYVHAILQTLNL